MKESYVKRIWRRRPDWYFTMGKYIFLINIKLRSNKIVYIDLLKN